MEQGPPVCLHLRPISAISSTILETWRYPMKVMNLLDPNFQAALSKLSEVELPIETACALLNIKDIIDGALVDYNRRYKYLQDKFLDPVSKNIYDGYEGEFL